MKRWPKQNVLSALNIGCEECLNSARWQNICEALDKLDVSAYLKNILKSDLTNRLPVYDTEDGPKEYHITRGVTQGSVLGSPLWNIMYGDLLKIQLPPGA